MNNKNDKKTCLYIEPYVHVNIKNHTVFLYNTLNGERLVVDDSPAIAALLDEMTQRQNLNAMVVQDTLLEEKNLHGFLETCGNMQLINRYAYSKENEDHKKPVSLPAMMNFHRDREKMALDPERDPGQDIIKYLHRLNIYINSYRGSHYNTPLFRQAHKQFLFPYWSQEGSQLEFAAVRRLLEQVKDLGLCRVTLLGGNIFQYKELEDLTAYLAQLPLKTEFGVFYKDIAAQNLEPVDWEALNRVSFKIFVEPQFQTDILVQGLQLLKRFDIDSTCVFAVQSEADADQLEEVIDLTGHRQFLVKPFFNRKNTRFFMENIFIEKSDLGSPVVSKKEIYARSVMNPGAFGQFTVLSSGEVYSNVNEKPVGTIHGEVKQLLLNELSGGHGWFRLRKNLDPCRSCVYHQICPPVSNYEYALSRNDLCWRREESGGKAHVG